MKRDRRGPQPAERDLAFGADVDNARAKAKGDPCPRQEIGRRPIERDAQLMRGADGAHRKRSESGKRIVPGKSDQRRRADKRKNDRHDDAQPDPFRGDESKRSRARRSRPQIRRRRLRHAARPDIQRPICARSTSSTRHNPEELAIRHHCDAVRDVEHLLQFGRDIEDRPARSREGRASVR